MSTRHKLYLSVGSFAASTLLLEVTLTRFLAVAQFYHFAFLVISLALLGFAASGSLLSTLSNWWDLTSERIMFLNSCAFAGSCALAYTIVNTIPFDSYSIAWDRTQILYFGAYYFALSLPFLFSGLGIAIALKWQPAISHRVYAANLAGSALGAICAPVFQEIAGVPGSILTSIMIGLLPALIYGRQAGSLIRHGRTVATVLLLAGSGLFIFLTYTNLDNRGYLGMTISPYKGLAYARQIPGARPLLGRWGAISRIDILSGAATRVLPGLSYTYSGDLPDQLGLSIDGNSLLPISLAPPSGFPALEFLPEAAAFKLRGGANVAVLQPGGGLGVLQALAAGSKSVTAVLADPAIASSLDQVAPHHNPYRQPAVHLVPQETRIFLAQRGEKFALIYFPLTDPYRPITNGAYSLDETYDLTVEAFTAAYERLQPDGILVITRWLQTPPSESIRLVATLAAALREHGYPHSDRRLVVYRGIQTITMLVKLQDWTAAELAEIRSFCATRRYDLVWAPDIASAETNRFNRLPEPVYFLELQKLFRTDDPTTYYQNSPFSVAPPTDNRPFFFHFFKWRQTPAILAQLGHIWAPFGGSGYLILLALLILVILLSAGLIILPLTIPLLLSTFRAARRQPGPKGAQAIAGPPPQRLLVFLYFSLLGLAFLFIEIPLIQRYILVFGHSTYAFSAVVATMLTFSSLGSYLSRRVKISLGFSLAVLVLALAGTLPLVNLLSAGTLGWPFLPRMAVTLIALAPMSLMMGFPFPKGLGRLEQFSQQAIPWAWAINGCASVIAAVLAAIISISQGFDLVLWLGILGYALAGLVTLRWRE